MLKTGHWISDISIFRMSGFRTKTVPRRSVGIPVSAIISVIAAIIPEIAIVSEAPLIPKRSVFFVDSLIPKRFVLSVDLVIASLSVAVPTTFIAMVSGAANVAFGVRVLTMARGGLRPGWRVIVVVVCLKKNKKKRLN